MSADDELELARQYERFQKSCPTCGGDKAPSASRRKIICDHCGEEIHRGTNGHRGGYFGMVYWRMQGGVVDGRDSSSGAGYGIACKARCLDAIERRLDEHLFTMELDTALGPHGLATLVHFMTEPLCDRKSLEIVIHRLYFMDGELKPPSMAFDAQFKDPLWGYE